jgi:CDP-diacylglycerol--glycerol-3-phosphate 3-phosphatidyltransferase
MLSQKKPYIEKIIKPLALLLKPVSPNTLTLIGSIPPLLFFVFVTNNYLGLASLVLPFFALDLLDGMLARLNNRTSALGEFLDSTIDRISDFLLIISFAFAKLVRFELVIILLFASFMVSYARSRGELASKGKTSFDIGLIERTERIIGIFIGLIIYVLAPSSQIMDYNSLELVFMILILFSLITFIQRIFHAYKSL